MNKLASFKFYFSAAVTMRSFPYLQKMPNFRPLSMLHTQFERKHIEHAMQYIDRGEIEPLFMDSGAYSVWTGKQKENIEEYVDYMNSIDRYVAVVAQFDQIPGKAGQPRMPADCVESAEVSWKNFLWMYNGLNSPQKLCYVFHQDESVDCLKRALNWRDSEGRGVGIIGLSGDGNRSEKEIRGWVTEMMHIVREAAPSRPANKVHLFGMASEVTIGRAVDILVRNGVDVISDSTTHVQLGAFGKVMVPFQHQPVIVSGRQMPIHPDAIKLLEAAGLNIDDKGFDFDSEEVTAALDGHPFYLEMLPYKGGEDMYRNMKAFMETLNLTMDEIQHESYARTAVNIYYMQHRYDEILKEKATADVRAKKLF